MYVYPHFYSDDNIRLVVHECSSRLGLFLSPFSLFSTSDYVALCHWDDQRAHALAMLCRYTSIGSTLSQLYLPIERLHIFFLDFIADSHFCNFNFFFTLCWLLLYIPSFCILVCCPWFALEYCTTSIGIFGLTLHMDETRELQLQCTKICFEN